MNELNRAEYFEGVLFKSDGTYLRGSVWKSGSDNGRGYKKVRIKGKSFFVHRIIAKLFIPNDNPKYTQVDHLNRDKSDNRVENLRWVSNQMNCQNKSNQSLHGLGVYFDERSKTFSVSFRIDGKNKHFGSFPDKESAQKCAKENNPIN